MMLQIDRLRLVEIGICLKINQSKISSIVKERVKTKHQNGG